MEDMIRIAVLGAGHIARAFSTALKGVCAENNLVMYAVASRSLKKAEAFMNEWGYEKAYGSYEELASDENVDLIYIATPHSEHYSNARLCISHGRNLLVEKAFTANLKQTEELIKLASEKGTFLAEAMWTRYMPSYDIIEGIIDSHEIGQIHYVESDFSVPIIGVERLVNPALAGGSLLDLGVYSLTIPAMYLGYDIKSIKLAADLTDQGVDATTVAMLTYGDGTMVRCKSSFVDEKSNYSKFVGDKGYMVFAPINCPEWVKIYDVNGEQVREVSIPSIVNGYEYEILECAECIRQGNKESYSMPLSETVRMMGWMDSIRNKIGVQYPFEDREDIIHDDLAVWGIADIFAE